MLLWLLWLLLVSGLSLAAWKPLLYLALLLQLAGLALAVDLFHGGAVPLQLERVAPQLGGPVALGQHRHALGTAIQ